MKDFIEKSGLTASQFAKKYDIPYNTVRQWAEGIRIAPKWLVKLFEAEQAYKPLIKEAKKKATKNKEMYAIETLVEIIDDNAHSYNMKLQPIEKKEEIIGMIKYAWYIDLITADKCEYYKRCVKFNKYV